MLQIRSIPHDANWIWLFDGCFSFIAYKYKRDRREQLDANKYLDEMDKSLEPQKLQRLNYEELKNLVIPIANKETESIIKNLQRKALDLMAWLMNSTKHLKN